jgi:hypothetical protein
MKNLYIYNIKYFNFIFYFNFIKYFNFIFYFFKKNIVFNKINSKLILLNIDLKKNYFKKNYILGYFNLLFFKTTQSIKMNVQILNYNNYKNLINILYNFNIQRFNYLVFDKNSYLHNLYINIFSLKNLLIFKKYFYVDPKYFTHKNFIYFYNQFLIDNNIYLIIIFNIKNILNFSNILENFNIVWFIFNDKFVFFKNSYNLFVEINFFSYYLYILLFNQI